jgi:uncharacterized damage-inducible protein DinB
MKVLESVLCLLMVCLIHHNSMAQAYFKNEYPSVWQRATDYTLEVAAAMPAEKWAFKPTAESMAFQEQLVHLVQNLSFLSGHITGSRPDFFKGKDPQALSKQELSQILQEAFGYVGRLIAEVDDQTLQESIEFGGEKMPKENIFYLMRDHATHHRAQAILYLRMNGVEAPNYRGW